jgi:hypothetical protein
MVTIEVEGPFVLDELVCFVWIAIVVVPNVLVPLFKARAEYPGRIHACTFVDGRWIAVAISISISISISVTVSVSVTVSIAVSIAVTIAVAVSIAVPISVTVSITIAI